jgi:hypothetical protein
MRKIARVDANQPEIVKALRKAGFHVTHLHTIGGGVPDLLIVGPSRSGRILALLCEVKSAKGELTDDEAKFFDKFPAGGPAIVARSADEVLSWFSAN